MAQSFWQNLFSFKSAIAATAITAAIAIATPTKAFEQPVASPQILPPNQPNTNQITPPIFTSREPGWRCPTQLPSECQPWIPEQPGATQQNPIMPTVTRPNRWEFINIPRGNWVDPPTAYGFRYQMTSDSLFTEIIDFPTGFANPFTVLVKDAILGEFTAGNSVKFSNYSTLLGDLLVSDRGVKEFSIIGLNVDPTNPTAFPLQLDFNTDTANFNMYPLLNQESQSVPEPSAILGLLTSSAFLIRITRKRQQKLLD